MKIGWVRDLTLSERPGGAQICEGLLREGVPPSVELVECPPGAVRDDVDAYIALRCQRYSVEEINQIVSKPCFHWAMDYWEWDNFEQRHIMFTKARYIVFGSPLHKSVFVHRWGLGQKAGLLPYPMDVERWLNVRKRSNGRSGAMWYGEAHPYKGFDIVIAWARAHGINLDIYGIGGFPQTESDDHAIKIKGFVRDEDLDLALASHEYFIHFPRSPEGFCYSLMEAWLAGLSVIYSGRIGLDSWDMPWIDLARDCNKSTAEFWKLAERWL